MLMMWNKPAMEYVHDINARHVIHENIVLLRKNKQLVTNIAVFFDKCTYQNLMTGNAAHFILKVTYLKYFLCGI